MFSFLDVARSFFDHLYKFDVLIGLASYVLLFAGAYLAYRQQYAQNNTPLRAKSFFLYMLPYRDDLKSEQRFKSYRIDMIFTAIKHFVNGWFLAPLLISNLLAANYAYKFLTSEFGIRESHTTGWLLSTILLALFVLLADFTQFLIHYFHHHLHCLWDIHKVHHSTEHMIIPFSVKRTHLLEELINLLATSLLGGTLIGLTSYIFSIEIWQTEFYGVDSWFILQLASFWHLRHSHMSLSYGWLENIFQSPAQHHLHHSREVEHWDKNFGLLFSFWDKIFGCFLRSIPPENC